MIIIMITMRIAARSRHFQSSCLFLRFCRAL